MRIASFDIFDTALTRMVGRPADIFLIVADELRAQKLISINPEEFVKARVEAEIKARDAYEHREVTFDEIYAVLQKALRWSDAQAASAKQIELDTERTNLRATSLARERINAARKQADRILFVSDMYLPGVFLKDILTESGLWREGDEIFVSGEAKVCKASGEMFGTIRGKLGQVTSWTHLGDNEVADVRRPTEHGISAEHFPHCYLTRYEAMFRPLDAREIVPLWRSRIAAAMRLGRVSFAGGSNHENGLWDIGASVAGPFLFGFLVWALEEAVKRGVQRLYFISRDGEILLKVAQRIIDAWKLPIEAKYLYGSRQAWIPAAGLELDSWFRDWALTWSAPTDVKTFFIRMGVAAEDFAETLKSGGFPPARWTELLTIPERERLWELVVKSEIGVAVRQRRKEQRDLAVRYLIQEGLGNEISIGIVDVGWLGSMQRSLDLILSEVAARNAQPALGFYIGLLRRPEEIADRTFAYWVEKKGMRPLMKSNFGIFERFAVGTHGSVRNYREEGDRVVPNFEPVSDGVMKWGAATLHASILAFTNIALETVGRGEIDLDEMAILVRRNFQMFAESPTLDEAKVFGMAPVDDQQNQLFSKTLIPDLSEWEMLRAALNFRRRMPGWWMEGTAKLTGSPSLRLFLCARRLRGKLRGED